MDRRGAVRTDRLPELFLVKEVHPDITVLVTRRYSRESRIHRPLHADNFFIRFAEVCRVREHEVSRDLLLQRHPSLWQRRAGGEGWIYFQLVEAEYTLEAIGQGSGNSLADYCGFTHLGERLFRGRRLVGGNRRIGRRSLTRGKKLYDLFEP